MRRRDRGGSPGARGMIALLLALSAGGPAPAAQGVPADTLPRLTLSEALKRAARLDPNYVRALGAVDNAAWARRAAMSAMVLPSISVGSDYTSFSTSELFTGGRKFATLSQAGADLESARAGEDQQRFLSALTTEADFYNVLSSRELVDVSRDRARRAEEQLVVARARVMSGAAVQSDSLQLVLELTRARVQLLQDEARLRVARLVLGQRVGAPGGIDAVPLDTARAPDLPLSLIEAMTQAVEQGPEYRVARANERSAEAALKARRGSYLPSIVLSANEVTFGDHFYPEGLTRRTFTVSLSYPLWDNANRELNYVRAKNARELARATRADLERAAEADVTAAWEAYQTARATSDLSATALVVARETYRVQDARYRGGASTILDLLDAQSRLSEAQADLVQARYAARLALAGLEAILGRRLFGDKE